MAPKKLAAKMQASLRSQACKKEIKQASARAALEAASAEFQNAIAAYRLASEQEELARNAYDAAVRARTTANQTLIDARSKMLRIAAGEA